MSIAAYRAKTALIDLLRSFTHPGDYLDGVTVSYSWKTDLGNRCVYGGWVSGSHQPEVAENPGLLVREDSTVNLYVKAVDSPPTDVETTDMAVEGIIAGIGALLKANPKVGGGFSWTGISSFNGDYSESDDHTESIAVLRVGFSTQLSYGI